MASKKMKIKGRRANSIPLSSIFSKESCACCRDKVYWYHVIENLNPDNKPDYDVLICLDCGKKYGFKHIHYKRHLWVYRDYREWE